MNWYEAIYIRKSVRRYSKKAVAPALLEHIENCAEKLNFLRDKACCSVKIYSAKEAQNKIKGFFLVNAPYYMVVFAKKTPESLIEAGCYAERLVLYMTTKGLGTCYQGVCQLNAEEVPANMQTAIVIAFGYAEGKMVRDERQAKRYPLSKICHFQENAGEEIRNMLKAARMAPSAMNRQPWRFMVWSDRIDLYIHKDGFMQKIAPNCQLVDVGIALCHLLEAADEQWISVSLEYDAAKQAYARKQRGKELYYVITVKKQEN